MLYYVFDIVFYMKQFIFYIGSFGCISKLFDRECAVV